MYLLHNVPEFTTRIQSGRHIAEVLCTCNLKFQGLIRRQLGTTGHDLK